MSRAYTLGTRAMAVIVMALGIAMIVVTLARGGGPLAAGVVLGLMFTVLGAGRFYLSGVRRQ